jgi:hypothetical protein
VLGAVAHAAVQTLGAAVANWGGGVGAGGAGAGAPVASAPGAAGGANACPAAGLAGMGLNQQTGIGSGVSNFGGPNPFGSQGPFGNVQGVGGGAVGGGYGGGGVGAGGYGGGGIGGGGIGGGGIGGGGIGGGGLGGVGPGVGAPIGVRGSGANAQQVANRVSADTAALDQIFGVHLQKQNITLDPNYNNGAFHNINTPQNITVGTAPGSPSAVGLADAEVVESAELAKGNGWQPGSVNGEALSRFLAGQADPSLNQSLSNVKDFTQAGSPNVITNNLQTDQNIPADVGGTLFLSYLHNALGFSDSQIVNAGGNTLGQTFQNLTGQSGQVGYQSFVQALQAAQARNPNAADPFAGF